MRKLSQEIKDKCYIRNKWIDSIWISEYKYFEAEINFQVPRAWFHRIFFDAIVSHRAYEYVLWQDSKNLSYDYDEHISLRLPLKKQLYNSGIMYSASCINTIPQQTSKKTKRFIKSIPWSINTRRISVQVWSTKSFMIDVPYDKIVKYKICWVWHIETLRKIMPRDTYIWKSSAIWYGKCTIDIQEKSDWKKWFWWFVDYRELIRPCPCERVDKHMKVVWPYNIERLPISPPYFWRDAKYYNCYTEWTKIEKL